MPAARSQAIVTYNGIDGAAAAAAILLKAPEAHVRVSSQGALAHTLGELAGDKRRYGCVHICGVGFSGDREELRRAAEKLRQRKTRVLWYCGRGYLQDMADLVSEVAEPVFSDSGTNTAAVCSHLSLPHEGRPAFLMRLASIDPFVAAGDDRRAGEKELLFARDHLYMAMDAYFEYRDLEAYANAITSLATGGYTVQDEAKIKAYRTTGTRFRLSGRSGAMRQLRKHLDRCARADAPVLVLGESGVGKEHVARLIHSRSARVTGSFVAMNCAMFAGNVQLANSELFGHVAGAATDVKSARAGAFVSANGGVLFLDELAELPPGVQSKLLRVLEDRRVTPVGSDSPVEVDVRVLSATNANLPDRIRCAQFREDLYHRLSLLRIRCPALRDRPDDVEAIASEQVEALRQEGHELRLATKDMRLLRDYGWPGNVRQLIAILRRCAYLRQSVAEVLDDERRELEVLHAGADEGLLPANIDEVKPIEEIKRQYAAHVLRLAGGNVTRAAKAMDVAQNTLRDWLR